jgi:hypothetical protein
MKPFHEQFENKELKDTTLAVIRQARTIIEEYQAQRFTLTLRQLFYQFVSRDLIANDHAEYKRLGRIIVDARRGGYIGWNSIEDRTRNLLSLPTWDDPAEAVRDAADAYREDVWAMQPHRPEVWIEKDALLGVIEGVCNEFRVPYFSCRGNVSDSEMYTAGKRYDAAVNQGQAPVILHLGDHDPSGLDMTRDIHERLWTFSNQQYRAAIDLRRLALNIDQTAGLPPNTAKESDGRYAAYAKQYGDTSWELDALDPVFIANLIRTELDALIDPQAWADALAAEEANRQVLVKASANWSLVEQVLDEQ